MDYVSLISELNYMTQVVVMLYEDPTKEASSDQRFHVELHFSPGVNCCITKELPPGPGFRPHSRNQEHNKRASTSDQITRQNSIVSNSGGEPTSQAYQKGPSTPPSTPTKDQLIGGGGGSSMIYSAKCSSGLATNSIFFCSHFVKTH